MKEIKHENKLLRVFQSKVKKLPKFKLLKHEFRDIVVTVVKAEKNEHQNLV